MKKTTKQRKKQYSKATYIAAMAAVFVGSAALVSLVRLSPLTLQTKEQESLSLPEVSMDSAWSGLSSIEDKTPDVSETVEMLPTMANDVLQTEEAEPGYAASAPVTPPKLIMPAAGEIMHPFSGETLVKSKTMGDWRVHSGVDIRASIGDAVYAAADGVIEQAYRDPQMGFTIIVAHGGDYKTLYQNLASVDMVTVGQKVAQGDCIAAVGDSAAAEMLEEAHLHFAMQNGTEFISPTEHMQ